MVIGRGCIVRGVSRAGVDAEEVVGVTFADDEAGGSVGEGNGCVACLNAAGDSMRGVGGAGLGIVLER